MKLPIGGFFSLEAHGGGRAYHTRYDQFLSSGRASLHYILEAYGKRFSKVLVPYYACDAVLEGVHAAGHEVVSYAIDAALEPAELPADDDAVVLLINFFGVKDRFVNSMIEKMDPDSFIVDNAHSFYHLPETALNFFNSPRKFFGVPDGSFVRCASADGPEVKETFNGRMDHLVNRDTKSREQAFAEYRHAETLFNARIRHGSRVSLDILNDLDHERIRSIRRENFAILHGTLGSSNQIHIDLESDAAPYCYPYLPKPHVDREALLSRSVFFPRLWADVIPRASEAGRAWEVELAEHMLPLPIDQRYGREEMEYVLEMLDEC